MASSSSSSPSAMGFSSQLWKYDVFLSFRGEDTRKNFVDHLYTALVQQGIYTYKDDETLPWGEPISPSLMTAIEESQIAIVVFSKNYADSSWCLDELAYIMKCKDTRGQIVMPVFYDVDPSEVRKQKRKYGEAFVKHELENKAKVESWRKALVDAANISGGEIGHIANAHESKCIKKIVDTISHRLYPVTPSVDDNLVGVEARMQDLISKLQIGFGGKRMIGIWGVGGGEILCGVLRQKQVQVRRVEEGRRMIKDRLHHRKVLIVLDDVDNLEHLEELVGSHDWFGEGSRIIITTRDEHILTGHKVDVIHNISLLNNDESMKLFCKHAPRGYKHVEDYELLSKKVVAYAGGLPLALRVLGRFLCDKDMNEWRSALARLKEIPDANILEKLKISFDGLKTVEKQLFLDIACFFRGCYKNEQNMMILDACGYHPVIGIKVLVQKALITISENGTFDMHDLVQELAHYIVRGEHPKNPEKHSRLWKKKDVLKICAMDATPNLDKIEAMYVALSRREESQHVLQVAANMKKLRCIELVFHLEAELVIIPESFPPRELCCLSLSFLKAKQLWEGYKFLPNLRMIKLYYLMNLMKTPDFDGIPNLERFIVEGSSLLEEIHPSFGRLEKLVYVQIQRCENLKMVPPITRSKKLKTFVLSGCSGLAYSHSKIQQNMENFVPHNMNTIRMCFFSGCLRKLDLSLCNLGDGDIRPAAVWELPNLQHLNLEGNRFVRLNFSLLRVPRLRYLNISKCYNLVELPELPSSIAVVIADGCFSLKRFGDISNCKWLWKVTLTGNHKLDPPVCDKLLNSMLQGNAKDYFISISLSGIDIWSGPSVVWIDWVKTYNMRLPHDWCNHFSGILMFVRCGDLYLDINISIKQGGLDEDFQSQIWQESDETPDTHSQETFVGYVSFSSLRHIGCLNSIYNVISFSFGAEDLYGNGNRFRAVLVPKDDPMQTTKVATDCLDFWDEKDDSDKTFKIRHDSNSSIKILWRPWVGLTNPSYGSIESLLFPSFRPQTVLAHYYW
ncbi:unnamed protein product [Lactuca virosa]|uniref:TIR domain-containing protein n=1 Tax=Lactuca virosa TaxID=75947 RepID=A0AAU9MZN8_9ASTR|nr:unnamed protein product [Lactuca virosa]